MENLPQHQNAENLFRMLASGLPVGVFLMDSAGNTIYTNSQWNTVFGFSLEDSLESDWRDYIHPDDREKTVDEWHVAVSDNSVLSMEFRILNSRNELKWIAWHSDVVLSDEGANVVGTVVDITDRKNAEIALRNAQAQLLQSEKLAGIGQLAAGIAHEINNPVGFVASNTTSLAEYATTLLKIIELYENGVDIAVIQQKKSEFQYDFIKQDIENLIKENLDGLLRIMSIVRNLKDFSRIDKSNAYVPANLNESITNTLAVARNEIKYHAEVRTELGEIPLVVCNISEMNQVFLNMIINAAQAIDGANKGKLGEIIIKTFADGDEVVCEISDDGPGIPDNVLPKIFDPFFTTKDVGKGTGLGLSISYDIIVNKHKGHVQVKTGNEGTTFTIRLPVDGWKNTEEKKL